MNIINGENVGLILFFIGIWGLITKKNAMKSIISLSIIQTAIILFYLSSSDPKNEIPPVNETVLAVNAADPLVQALMITEIVIGAGITAASLVMFVHLYHKYTTADWSKLKD